MHLLDLGENIVAGLVIRRHPVPPGLDVPVGRINGLIIQQGTCEDRQVGTTMSAFDAVISTLSPYQRVFLMAGQTSAHCPERSWP